MSFLGSKRRILKPQLHNKKDDLLSPRKKRANLDRKTYSSSIFDLSEKINFSSSSSQHGNFFVQNTTDMDPLSKCNDRLNFYMNEIDEIEEKFIKRRKTLKKLRELRNGRSNGAVNLFFSNKIFNVQNEISLMMNDYNFIVENYNHQLESISFVHECRSLSNDLIQMNETLTLEALAILRKLQLFKQKMPKYIQQILTSYEKKLKYQQNANKINDNDEENDFSDYINKICEADDLFDNLTDIFTHNDVETANETNNNTNTKSSNDSNTHKSNKFNDIDDNNLDDLFDSGEELFDDIQTFKDPLYVNRPDSIKIFASPRRYGLSQSYDNFYLNPSSIKNREQSFSRFFHNFRKSATPMNNTAVTGVLSPRNRRKRRNSKEIQLSQNDFRDSPLIFDPFYLPNETKKYTVFDSLSSSNDSENDDLKGNANKKINDLNVKEEERIQTPRRKKRGNKSKKVSFLNNENESDYSSFDDNDEINEKSNSEHNKRDGKEEKRKSKREEEKENMKKGLMKVLKEENKNNAFEPGLLSLQEFATKIDKNSKLENPQKPKRVQFQLTDKQKEEQLNDHKKNLKLRKKRKNQSKESNQDENDEENPDKLSKKGTVNHNSSKNGNPSLELESEEGYAGENPNKMHSNQLKINKKNKEKNKNNNKEDSKEKSKNKKYNQKDEYEEEIIEDLEEADQHNHNFNKSEKKKKVNKSNDSEEDDDDDSDYSNDNNNANESGKYKNSIQKEENDEKITQDSKGQNSHKHKLNKSEMKKERINAEQSDEDEDDYSNISDDDEKGKRKHKKYNKKGENKEKYDSVEENSNNNNLNISLHKKKGNTIDNYKENEDNYSNSSDYDEKGNRKHKQYTKKDENSVEENSNNNNLNQKPNRKKGNTIDNYEEGEGHYSNSLDDEENEKIKHKKTNKTESDEDSRNGNAPIHNPNQPLIKKKSNDTNNSEEGEDNFNSSYEDGKEKRKHKKYNQKDGNEDDYNEESINKIQQNSKPNKSTHNYEENYKNKNGNGEYENDYSSNEEIRKEERKHKNSKPKSGNDSDNDYSSDDKSKDNKETGKIKPKFENEDDNNKNYIETDSHKHNSSKSQKNKKQIDTNQSEEDENNYSSGSDEENIKESIKHKQSKHKRGENNNDSDYSSGNAELQKMKSKHKHSNLDQQNKDNADSSYSQENNEKSSSHSKSHGQHSKQRNNSNNDNVIDEKRRHHSESENKRQRESIEKIAERQRKQIAKLNENQKLYLIDQLDSKDDLSTEETELLHSLILDRLNYLQQKQDKTEEDIQEIQRLTEILEEFEYTSDYSDTTDDDSNNNNNRIKRVYSFNINENLSSDEKIKIENLKTEIESVVQNKSMTKNEIRDFLLKKIEELDPNSPEFVFLYKYIAQLPSNCPVVKHPRDRKRNRIHLSEEEKQRRRKLKIKSENGIKLLQPSWKRDDSLSMIFELSNDENARLSYLHSSQKQFKRIMLIQLLQRKIGKTLTKSMITDDQYSLSCINEDIFLLNEEVRKLKNQIERIQPYQTNNPELLEKKTKFVKFNSQFTLNNPNNLIEDKEERSNKNQNKQNALTNQFPNDKMKYSSISEIQNEKKKVEQQIISLKGTLIAKRRILEETIKKRREERGAIQELESEIKLQRFASHTSFEDPEEVKNMTDEEKIEYYKNEINDLTEKIAKQKRKIERQKVKSEDLQVVLSHMKAEFREKSRTTSIDVVKLMKTFEQSKEKEKNMKQLNDDLIKVNQFLDSYIESFKSFPESNSILPPLSPPSPRSPQSPRSPRKTIQTKTSSNSNFYSPTSSPKSQTQFIHPSIYQLINSTSCNSQSDLERDISNSKELIEKRKADFIIRKNVTVQNLHLSCEGEMKLIENQTKEIRSQKNYITKQIYLVKQKIDKLMKKNEQNQILRIFPPPYLFISEYE